MQQTTGNARLMVKKLAMLITMLVAALIAANSASAQQNSETATVTFQLTIDGVVPEGRTFGLGYKPIIGWDFQGVSFCTTDTEDPDLPDESTLPVCEDGGTYSGTLEVPAGVPFSFDYLVHADVDDVRCDPPRIGPLEAFYSDTRTFTEDATVNATYTEDGLPTGCRAVDEEDSEEPRAQPQCFLPEGCFLSGDGSHETIAGGIGPDYIIGGGGHDAVHGLGGGDWLDGGTGDDLVRGNAGDDLVDGGSGHDLVIGYLGNDILAAGRGSDYIYAADGWFDEISGGRGYDVCVVDPWDDVRGCEEVHTG
jgi:hypothetical protein